MIDIIIVMILIGVASILASVRILIGPTGPDRAVGLDNATTITTCLIVILSLLFNRSIYLDVALVYAILSFVGVVVIARYLEGGI